MWRWRRRGRRCCSSESNERDGSDGSIRSSPSPTGCFSGQSEEANQGARCICGCPGSRSSRARTCARRANGSQPAGVRGRCRHPSSQSAGPAASTLAAASSASSDSVSLISASNNRVDNSNMNRISSAASGQPATDQPASRATRAAAVGRAAGGHCAGSPRTGRPALSEWRPLLQFTWPGSPRPRPVERPARGLPEEATAAPLLH